MYGPSNSFYLALLPYLGKFWHWRRALKCMVSSKGIKLLMLNTLKFTFICVCTVCMHCTVHFKYKLPLKKHNNKQYFGSVYMKHN